MTPGPHKRPLIVAHRGAMREAPENTRAAFKLALESPIDGIEFDTQMTADGVCVVHHDEDILRIAGKPGRVSDLAFSQLSKADWGTWFSPNFSAERIVRLDEMFRDFGPRTRLLVEIKSFPHDAASGHDISMTRAVIAAIQPDQVVYVLSFDRHILEFVREEARGLRCVLNTNDPEGDMAENYGEDFLSAYSTSVRKLSRKLTSFAAALGKQSMTWGCNEPNDVAKALDCSVDVIMTDRPAWIVEYLSREHDWNFGATSP